MATTRPARPTRVPIMDADAYRQQGQQVVPVYAVTVTATLAEINAGKAILPAVDGVAYRIVGLFALVTGAFTGLTALVINDTSDSPVAIASIAQASLSNGAKFNESDFTLGAGFLAALGAGKGVRIGKSGGTAAGGTSVTLRVLYSLVD